MKRYYQKIFAWIILPALLLGILHNVVFAKEATQEETDTYTLGEQYIAPVGDYSVRLETQHRQERRGELSSYYNSTKNGYTTPVRNQEPYSSCWSHSAIASCEIYMIKHKIPVGVNGCAATSNLNLSETHLTWFSFTDAYDSLAMLTGNKNNCASDTYNYLNVGGNGKFASYTLMRWEGLTSEDPTALAYSNASENGLPDAYAYAYNVAHVQDCIWISASDQDAVKTAIMEYGAGIIGYYYDSAYDSNGTYYYNGDLYPNHDATVVGWDDSYSRYNFKGDAMPSCDGAWIVKNSWGESYGNNGYSYLSYEDTSANKDTCYFYAVESVDNYSKNYQYDGTNNMVSYCAIADGERVANVFTAESKEELSAVAFCNEDAGIDYTLQIYTGISADPTDGKLTATQTGTFPYAGYHTVKLNTPISLNAGEKFSVVFTLDNHYQNATTIPVDETGYHDIQGWASWYHPVREGTSFLYEHSKGRWMDISKTLTFRIKAYTKYETNEQKCHYQSFYDCNDSWYHEAVDFAVAEGLMNGVGGGKFEPFGTMNRAMVVTVLYRMNGSPKVGKASTFSDVPTGQWYSDAIAWAQECNIVGGVGNSRFAPEDTITREQIATILWRSKGKPTGTGDISMFRDATQISGYAFDAMRWAVNEGILNGDSGKLKPIDSATRAEFACIILRYLHGSYPCLYTRQ